MQNFRSPVDDILCALRVSGADRLPGWDAELAAHVIAEAGRFVDAEIAPLDPLGDAEGVAVRDGRACLPEPFRAAYAKFRDAGWPGLVIDPAHGGQGLPHVLWTAVSEMLAGGCLSLHVLLSLAQGAARTVALNGSPEQRRRYLLPLASGAWLATMCLSEPEAGSELGRVATLARPDGNGAWRLRGSKIFITGGDQDLTAERLHLVLARTPDMPPGAKGLALFACPSRVTDGGANAVRLIRVEDKMGLHASPTCQLAFEDAWAEMLGAPGEGLARMFTMMNAERLDMGVQGIGLMEAASQKSRAYAATRVQGRPAGGRRTIDGHGDVQRMLLTQLALLWGGRVMALRAAVALDRLEDAALAAFLTPVCKAFCTDGAVEAANLAIQVFGGYGYLREYRVEQLARDARITPIYEGTNGIQAMTLAGRGLRQDNGAGPAAFEADVRDAIGGAGGFGAHIEDALGSWRVATDLLMGQTDPGPAAAPYLRLTGLVGIGAGLARLGREQDRAPSPARLRAVLAFAAAHLLPEAALLRERVARAPEWAETARTDGVWE